MAAPKPYSGPPQAPNPMPAPQLRTVIKPEPMAQNPQLTPEQKAAWFLDWQQQQLDKH